VEAAGARPNAHPGELETPIFTGAGRRLPWLRAAAIAFGVLVVLWLAALVAGMVGFGAVSGLSLPGLGGSPAPVLHRAPAPVTSAGVRSRLTGAAVAGRHPSATGRGRAAARRTGASGTAGGSTTSSSRGASGTGHRNTARHGSSTSSSSATSGGGALGGAITHGQRIGQSRTPTTTSSSPSSSSHRSTAPGQSDVKPGGGSPQSRANRTTTLG
jgi:hypothetical protein